MKPQQHSNLNPLKSSEEKGPTINGPGMPMTGERSPQLNHGFSQDALPNKVIISAKERAEKEKKALEYLKDLSEDEDPPNINIEDALGNLYFPRNKTEKTKESYRTLSRHGSLPITPDLKKVEKLIKTENEPLPTWDHIEKLERKELIKQNKLRKSKKKGSRSPRQNQDSESKEQKPKKTKKVIEPEKNDSRTEVEKLTDSRNSPSLSGAKVMDFQLNPNEKMKKEIRYRVPIKKMSVVKIPDKFRIVENLAGKEGIEEIGLNGRGLSLPKIGKYLNETHSRPSTRFEEISRRLDMTSSAVEEFRVEKDRTLKSIEAKKESILQIDTQKLYVDSRKELGRNNSIGTLKSVLLTKSAALNSRSQLSPNDSQFEKGSGTDEITPKKDGKETISVSERLRNNIATKLLNESVIKSRENYKIKVIDEDNNKEKDNSKEKDRLLPPIELTKLHPSKYTKQVIPTKLQAGVQGRSLSLMRLPKERIQISRDAQATEDLETSKRAISKDESKDKIKVPKTVEFPPISVLCLEIQNKKQNELASPTPYQDLNLYKKPKIHPKFMARTKSVSTLNNKLSPYVNIEEFNKSGVSGEFNDINLAKGIDENGSLYSPETEFTQQDKTVLNRVIKATGNSITTTRRNYANSARLPMNLKGLSGVMWDKQASRERIE